MSLMLDTVRELAIDAVGLQSRRMITGSQIKAARALLGWQLRELSKLTGLSYATVQRAEAAGGGVPTAYGNNLAAIEAVLTAAGVQFIDEDAAGGRGVRLVRRT